MVEKYTTEVSVTKIVERIKYLVRQGVPSPLRKEWVANGFGGTRWNMRETDAINFNAGFDYLKRCRAIKVMDTETFELLEYFETFAPEYHAPPSLPIQIDRQISNEAENMQHCYYWLYVFENTLRNFVQGCLSETYGENWYDELSQKVRRGIEHNEKGWPGGIPPRTRLEFTTLSALRNIIMSKWKEVFEVKFGTTNPTSLGESLNRIEEFRNTIVHTRMLREDESRVFYSEISRVLSCVKLPAK
jgi:hypothetical protein